MVIKASLQRAVRIEGVTPTKARQAEPGTHGRRPDGWVLSVVCTSCGKHAGLECFCSLPSCEGLAQVDLWSEATWEPTVRLCLRCCPQLLPRGGQCVCQGVLAAGFPRPGFTTSALCMGTRSLSAVGAVLGPVGCGAASLASTPPWLSCDNPKCLQTLP